MVRALAEALAEAALKVFKVCDKLYIPPLTDLESLIK